MEELYNIGISEVTIKSMLEINPELVDISSDEIIEKENILRDIKCNDTQVRNIISSNPMFLTRTNSDIIKLLEYLTKLGFNTLNILFDSNPYILNFESYEIENYIKRRNSSGDDIQDIIDDLDSNPYLFNEI